MCHGKKRQVHDRLPEAVFHDPVTTLMRKGLIGIAGGAVISDYVVQKLNFLKVLINEGSR